MRSQKNNNKDLLDALLHFKETIDKLRDPKYGCPWDLEQTHASLTRYLLEESYEFIEAVEKKDYESMEDELGDVMLQVGLHSKIASEKNKFNLASVLKKQAIKLEKRHPHVFDPKHKRLTTKEVVIEWEARKIKENKKYKYVLKDKLLNNPSLKTAELIGLKTSKIKFDWNSPYEVFKKVEEELLEVKEEIYKKKVDPSKIKEEIGDLLFSTAQLARHFNFEPEQVLKEANMKFLKRFNKIEDHMDNQGLSFEEVSREKLESLWIKVKSDEA